VRERLRVWVTSLSAKYIALFALLVGVPVIGTSAYLLYSSYQDNKRALIRLQQEKAKIVAVTIDQYFTDLTHRVRAVTGSYLSFRALGAVLKPLLERDVRTAFYVDIAGRKTLARTGGELVRLKGDFSHERSVETAHATGRYFGPVSAPGGLGNPRRTIKVAVEEGSGFAGAGVVGETLELGGIRDLLSQTRLGTSGYVYLVDSKGGPVAYPNSAAFTHRSLAFSQVKRALASSSNAGSTVGRNFRRQKVLSAWATVQPVGWKVFVEPSRPAGQADADGSRPYRRRRLRGANRARPPRRAGWVGGRAEPDGREPARNGQGPGAKDRGTHL
jgi:two-component system NtrC family sensor kinase